METKTMPCPIYWISVEPEALIEVPCPKRDDVIILWRCGLCDEWHGVWPEEGEKAEKFQSPFEALNEEWTKDDYRAAAESIAEEGWTGDDCRDGADDSVIPFHNL